MSSRDVVDAADRFDCSISQACESSKSPTASGWHRELLQLPTIHSVSKLCMTKEGRVSLQRIRWRRLAHPRTTPSRPNTDHRVCGASQMDLNRLARMKDDISTGAP